MEVRSSNISTDIKLHAGYVWTICSIGALGGLLFGYDWVVIGGAKPFYEKYFRLESQGLIGWANSCALLGCLMGSLIAGGASDRFGRKKLLIFSAFLFGASSLLTGWAETFRMFILWRILGGVAIGVASNVSPTYIAEISPAPWRGRLVTLNQLTIVIGILAAQIVNWMIAENVPPAATAEMIRQSWNGQYGWRWMFTAVAVPSAAFFVAALFVPESPRWLAERGMEARARATLKRIGESGYADQALTEIMASLSSQSAQVHWADLLRVDARRILQIGIFLAVLQQWSGINVIFNYAEEVYRGAGYGVSDVLFNIVITGSVNLLFTLVALALVDRFGRRPLMLFGCAGIAISHVLIGIAYREHLGGGAPVLVFTLSTIGCYAMSLAPVTWVLISEIYPNRIRARAVSVSVSALWIASFILTFTFPMFNRGVGTAGTFWIYAGICVVGFLFIRRRVPETKGKSLEQIESELIHG